MAQQLGDCVSGRKRDVGMTHQTEECVPGRKRDARMSQKSEEWVPGWEPDAGITHQTEECVPGRKCDARMSQKSEEWVPGREPDAGLSKIMGQKLSDNNLNIADLNDQNRPSKLAERYEELYNNHWTDAFEAVEAMNSSYSEKQCIDDLLCILKDAKTFCEEQYEKQMQDVCRAVALTPKVARDNLSEFTKKQVKDVLKGTVETNIPEIQKMFFQNNITNAFFQNAEVRPYINECITICWLMSVQDPPVVLGNDPQTNSVFDTNFFKHYTKTGTQMDYVVWPSLYLHKDGPLLLKGVAQAKTSMVRQRPSRACMGTSDRAQYKAQINNDGKQLHGPRSEQTQVQAYWDSPNDPLKAKEVYPMYSQNESRNETRLDPQQRDPDKPYSWDELKADLESHTTILYQPRGQEHLQSKVYPARCTSASLAQSTRPPAANPQMTGVYQPQTGHLGALWQEYSPTADDLKYFEFYCKNPNFYSKGNILRLRGQAWFDAFLRYKENKNNHSVSDV